MVDRIQLMLVGLKSAANHQVSSTKLRESEDDLCLCFRPILYSRWFILTPFSSCKITFVCIIVHEN